MELLCFTNKAALKAKSCVQDKDNGCLHLRLVILGGGCSGFKYDFLFEENQRNGDVVIENQGMKLLVDPMSFQYVQGSVVDYEESIDGSKFIISNPNARTSCGCGLSFAV